ncbi:MAG TPA: hydroxymethylbilane synthase [Acidimicrobiales bacterium]|nr:hydroxymethylbilane synthase [Acidimicrobiales bacterium]
MAPALRAATRRSTLARTQTDLVAALLGVEVEPVLVETSADRRPDTPIWELGDRGAFVREVQNAVLEGRADIAVHSAKDLPSDTLEELVIAAVPEREDARDALVGATLETLPVGGRVGTGAVRRRAQLSWLRSDLTFGGLRGNIETRLDKAGDFDAIVVAYAALRRLGRTGVADDILDVNLLVPQVGQGALAVECRADDERVRAFLAESDHGASHAALDAERAWLGELGGGCDRPVGAYATVSADGTIRLTAMLASGDGRLLVRRQHRGSDPREVGRELARQMLERAGGLMLLDEASPDVVAPPEMSAAPPAVLP